MRLVVSKRVVDSMTNLVRLKTRTELKKRTIDLYVKQFTNTEEDMVDELTPFFVSQINKIKSKLRGTVTQSNVESIVNSALNSDNELTRLIDTILPVLAKGMEKVLTESPELLGEAPPRSRSLSQKASGSEWLEEQGISPPPGVSTELPDWMLAVMKSSLNEIFEEDYWENVSDTTRGDIINIIERGLEEGLPLRDIVARIVNAAPEYSRNRATNVARTESGSALNSARKAAIDQLAEDIPEANITSSWLSVLAPETRPSHAELDGVLADENGMFNVSGHLVPYPSHHSLPPEERCNCLCTLLTEFGAQ